MVVVKPSNQPTRQTTVPPPPPYTPVPENASPRPDAPRPNTFSPAESSQSNAFPTAENTNAFPPAENAFPPQTLYQPPASFPLQDVHASQQNSFPAMQHEPVRLDPPAVPQSPARPKTQSEVGREYQERCEFHLH